MNSALIKRLRKIATLESEDYGAEPQDHSSWQAADLIERQAAQIEMMWDLISKRISDGFVSFGKYCCEQESLFNPSYNVMTPHKKRYLSDCEEALATPDQALEQFAAKVRGQCAKVCDTADKSTHPADLANAIRAIKELP